MKAQVARVEEHALYFTFEDIEIVVLIPDVSAAPIHLKQTWHVGDETFVKIVRYVEQERIYKGTMRDVAAPSGL